MSNLKPHRMRTINDNSEQQGNVEVKSIEITEPILHKLFKKDVIRDNRNAVEYKLYLGDFDHDEYLLYDIYNQLEDSEGYEEIDVVIQSCGGNVDEFMRFSNILRSLFYGRVRTYLNSYGYSCGALAFLIGDCKVAYEHSIIMFHDVSLGVIGKHSDVKTQQKFNEMYFDKVIRDYLKPYFTSEEIDDIFKGKEFWFDTLEMCKRKICDYVFYLGDYVSADEYIKICEDKKFKKEFVNQITTERKISKMDANVLLSEGILKEPERTEDIDIPNEILETLNEIETKKTRKRNSKSKGAKNE